MPKEEAEKALKNAQKRLERHMSRKGLDVSPEIYLVSEFGYYFGWDAVLAIRRGYTVEPVTGNKEVFTLDEAQILLEGARKVWYSKLTEQAHAQMVGGSFKVSSSSFNDAVKPFTDKAEVTE